MLEEIRHQLYFLCEVRHAVALEWYEATVQSSLAKRLAGRFGLLPTARLTPGAPVVFQQKGPTESADSITVEVNLQRFLIQVERPRSMESVANMFGEILDEIVGMVKPPSLERIGVRTQWLYEDPKEEFINRAVSATVQPRSAFQADFHPVALTLKGSRDAWDVIINLAHGVTLSGVTINLQPPQPPALTARNALTGLMLDIDVYRESLHIQELTKSLIDDGIMVIAALREQWEAYLSE